MLEVTSEHACLGGVQRFYSHQSKEIGLPMRLSVYLLPQARESKVPALFCLAGLSCTEETFMIKAGAQRIAAQQGLMLIAPDTSTRGANFPGEANSWDLGGGAGFYLDATEAPWNNHYRMYSYVLELYELIVREFSVHPSSIGITGHSMGGHGALVLALIDCYAPGVRLKRNFWKGLYEALTVQHLRWQQERIYHLFLHTLGFRRLRKMKAIGETHRWAHWSYKPTPYLGRIDLFLAAESEKYATDPLLGWSKVAKGGLVVHSLPGNHSFLVKPPGVDVLAEKLQHILDRIPHNKK